MNRKAAQDFQVFAKPTGPLCNLGCEYCYYLKKDGLYPQSEPFRMPDSVLVTYIVQHIETANEPEIRFSWHGGEPTVLGLDYFRKIVEFQRKHQPPGKRILNGMQTNGTLLDEEWCRFFADNNFRIGISLDGPGEIHDRYRLTKDGKPTFDRVIRGYELLCEYGIECDILCVVNSASVRYPLEIYRFFKEIGARYISFLPMVEHRPDTKTEVSPLTVPAESWGEFLCDVFDEWAERDISRIKVQIFEEAARTAFDQEHSLCIFRPTCGNIPVVEHNGDFFSCDHFVDEEHHPGNIMETPLAELLNNPAQQAFGQAKLDALPRYCLDCRVRDMCNGECPKNRFIKTPDGEEGLNYLCAGYKNFFIHCRPFISEISALWRNQSAEPHTSVAKTSAHTTPKTGRNEPCPCGSGLKYKKCCMNKAR